MAGVTGDICQVAVKALVGAVVMRNVFHYRLEDPGSAGYLDGLLSEFQTVVLTPYANSQLTSFTFVELVATNLFSGDEVVDVTPTPAAGTRTPAGDSMATFIAAMIVLERQNGRVRNGRKFIYLPQESDVTSSVLASGMVTLLNSLATGMASQLNPGVADLYTPAIIGRIPYTTSSGKVAYRLPVSQSEMGDKYSLVDSARLINRTTTMNSRKNWRGE